MNLLAEIMGCPYYSARSACFPHPVQMSQRGVRAAAVKACLVIYNDDIPRTTDRQTDRQIYGRKEARTSDLRRYNYNV